MTTSPRIRFESNPARSAVTPLELFFDLVFVFALTRVTDWMADDPTPESVLRGALILGVMWWCWVCYSWLGNVVKADEGVMRVGMFVAMAAVFVAAISIPEAFEDLPGGLSGPVVFAVCYFLVRAIHLVLFLLVSHGDPELRGQVLRFGISMGAGTVLLLVASETTGTVQTLLWVAALLGDYLGTALAGTKWRLASAAHFAERHGLIVIVALGESIVSIGIGVAELPVSWPIIAASALGLAVSGALWWSYFDVSSLVCERSLAEADGDRQIRMARGGYSFLHLPVVVGIIMLSLGLKKVLLYVGGGEEHELTDPLYGVPLAALVGGIALVLLGYVGFKRYLTGETSVLRIGTAVLLLVLSPLLALIPALLTLLVVAAVLVALVGIETHTFAEQRHAIRHSSHHG
ncbi:low temperature requirement protein A [Pseudonocardia sp. KRD291]|uniref:low temperature requirement protein A n=1 Tax=Pseudonocardia sp. KRD291 TaxID=2792007 RepID=UPI001C49FF88|nr:low temperature requirement protein A [Pseudonocardia sp. KRD291]MBW0103249.1 low temperature requirement protein A [Pseudonocardia sp. KRD291]